MEEILIRKLYGYIEENNPELLLQLQKENAVTAWLTQKIAGIAPMLNAMLEQNKPVYLIEEECMNLLTEDLRPSRFNYIRNVFEEEFPFQFEQAQHKGELVQTLLVFLVQCETVFEQFSFSESTEDDPLLRYAITGLLEKQLNLLAS